MEAETGALNFTGPQFPRDEVDNLHHLLEKIEEHKSAIRDERWYQLQLGELGLVPTSGARIFTAGTAVAQHLERWAFPVEAQRHSHPAVQRWYDFGSSHALTNNQRAATRAYDRLKQLDAAKASRLQREVSRRRPLATTNDPLPSVEAP